MIHLHSRFQRKKTQIENGTFRKQRNYPPDKLPKYKPFKSYTFSISKLCCYIYYLFIYYYMCLISFVVEDAQRENINKTHKKQFNSAIYHQFLVTSKYTQQFKQYSRYVDYYLQILLPNLESYLQDSFHLLNALSKLQLSHNMDVRFLTAEAVSMYTNINVTHALEVFGNYFADFNHELPSNYPTQLLLTLLNIVMNNNVFRFGDLYFLQTDGTAMGTYVAVMYAILYCSYRERTLIIPKYHHNIVYCKQFIDDIFCLWRDTLTCTW